jgi:hypothetical protein
MSGADTMVAIEEFPFHPVSAPFKPVNSPFRYLWKTYRNSMYRLPFARIYRFIFFLLSLRK